MAACGTRFEGEALRLVRERMALDAGFLPQTEDQRRALAQLAGEWGDHGTASALCRDAEN
jgi:hypothetical protein